MKHLYLIVIMVCIISSANAQTRTRSSGPASADPTRKIAPSFLSKQSFRTTAYQLNLKGKVKSIAESTYEASLKNGKIVKAAKAIDRTLLTFDLAGNKISEVIYKDDGSYLNSAVYKYAQPGMLTETQEFYRKENQLSERTTYEYNENNYLVAHTTYDSLNQITNQLKYSYLFEYRSNKYTCKKDSLIYKDRDDKSFTRRYIGDFEELVFNSDTNVISKKTKNSYSNTYVTYEYNPEKHVVLETYLDNHLSKGDHYDIVYSLEYKYDAKGNVISQVGTGNASSRNIKYMYDPHGNWIQRSFENYGDENYEKNYFVAERKIVYY